MLRYPDFFKVGVAFAGNHDDRSEHTIVGESWRGMLRKDSTGTDNYEGDANYLLASNLRGHRSWCCSIDTRAGGFSRRASHM